MSSSDDLDNLSDDYEYDPIPRLPKCGKREQVKNRRCDSDSETDDNEYDLLQGKINLHVTRTKTSIERKLPAMHGVSNDQNVQARTHTDSISCHRSRKEPEKVQHDDSVDTNFTKLQTDTRCSVKTPRKTVRGNDNRDKFKSKVEIRHIKNTNVKSKLAGKNQIHMGQVKKNMGKQNEKKDKESLHHEVVTEIKHSIRTLYNSDDEMPNDYVNIQSSIQDIVEDLPVLTDKTADTSINRESQKYEQSVEEKDNRTETKTEDFHGDSSSDTYDYFDGLCIGQSNNISEGQSSKVNNTNITKFCKPDDKKKYVCEHDDCNEVFTSQFKMYVHVKTVHRKGDKSAFKCIICDRQFAFQAHLKHHMLIHKDENQYECWVCQTGFKTPYYLKNHVKKVHKITDQRIFDDFHDRISLKVKPGEKAEIFKCEACEKVLSSRKQRQKHFLNVHNKKKQCDQCDKVFNSQSGLFDHKRTHSLVKLFECPYCQSRLSTIYSLQRHVSFKHGKTCLPVNSITKEHTEYTGMSFYNNQNPQTIAKSKKAGIACEVCGKTLKSSSMREHMATHTGEINFTCGHCGKGFYRMNGYKKHLRLHTGDKPYKCEKCLKSFRLRQALSRHLTVHEGLKPFVCQVCKRQFNRRSHLLSHSKTQHNGQGMPPQSKNPRPLQVNQKIN